MVADNIVQFDIFNHHPELVHAFSTRRGGFSRPPYHSLNLGLTCGDDSKTVQKNRDLYFHSLAVPTDRLVFPVQIHSKSIEIVDRPGIVNQCDALITNTPDLYLTILTADCFPVFVYDPITKTVAIIHSGWRGAALNISGNTIQKMIEKFNINPKNLIAAIGPGVQVQNFQVDNPVYQQFNIKYFIPDDSEHYKMDLQQLIFDQLIECEIDPKNIERNKDCTYQRVDLYYSFRRDGQSSGRMMGVIGLRK